MSDRVAVVDTGADRASIDAALARLCDDLPPLPPPLPDAIRYSVRSPGKRLRGILVCAAFRAAGGSGDPAPLAAAVEMLHAYSLVHDDLPCMDDDDMRRGRPTTHRVYGVNAAVVAGVALIPLVARLLKKHPVDELERICEEGGLPFARILTPSDLFDDPHLNAGGMLAMTLSDGTPTKIPALPIQFGGQRLTLRSPPPKPGEHNDELLGK